MPGCSSRVQKVPWESLFFVIDSIAISRWYHLFYKIVLIRLKLLAHSLCLPKASDAQIDTVRPGSGPLGLSLGVFSLQTTLLDLTKQPALR